MNIRGFLPSTLLWGDAPPVLAALRTLVKLAIAAALALLVHESLAALATRISPTAEGNANDSTATIVTQPISTKRLSIADLEIAINDAARGKFSVCLFRSSNVKHSCGLSYLPPLGSFVGFVVSPSENTANRSSNAGSQQPQALLTPQNYFFRVQSNLIPFVSTPRIEHSVHSFLREIERVAFNRSGDLRLCSGARKTLAADQCAITAAIETLYERSELPHLMEDIRFSAMIFGDVQYLTLVLFIMIAFEILGVWASDKAPILFQISRASGVDKLEMFAQLEFDLRYERYRKLELRSAGDQLLVALLPFRSSAFNRNDEIGPAGGASSGTDSAIESASAPDAAALGRERTILVEDADFKVAALEKSAENILKLSFGGTILGIGASLFAARNLDTADPINKILVKSEMFAGIGTAFGNTLVGIGLSMLAALLIGMLYSQQFRSIQYYFSVMEDFVSSGSKIWLKPIDPPPPPPTKIAADSLAYRVGMTVITILVLGLVVANISSIAEALRAAVGWTFGASSAR